MSPHPSDPVNSPTTRFSDWFDDAEAMLARWFTDEDKKLEKPEESVDLRSVSSAVLVLRRVIEGRRILDVWQREHDERFLSGEDADDLGLLETIAKSGCLDEAPDDSEAMPE